MLQGGGGAVVAFLETCSAAAVLGAVFVAGWWGSGCLIFGNLFGGGRGIWGGHADDAEPGRRHWRIDLMGWGLGR